MIKKHTAIFIATAILALPAAAQAQSNTASGSFTFTLNPTLPPGDQVQVVGLDDVKFGTVALSIGPTIVAQQQDFFCLNRTTPGDVLVTFEQISDPPADASFRMSKDASSYLPMAIKLVDINGQETGVERGVQFASPRSAAGCTEANAGQDIGHLIFVQPEPIPAGTAAGLYSTTIQITIAPAG
jgi:spore coat protein U-like protein